VWPTSILMVVTLGLVYAKAPTWLLIIFAAMFVLSMILYGFSYTFCLLNDRDALRSEKYSLNKLAIEHGLIGDSSAGLFEVGETRQQRALPPDTTKHIERKQ
jgi:hypothetical protein